MRSNLDSHTYQMRPPKDGCRFQDYLSNSLIYTVLHVVYNKKLMKHCNYVDSKFKIWTGKLSTSWKKIKFLFPLLRSVEYRRDQFSCIQVFSEPKDSDLLPFFLRAFDV